MKKIVFTGPESTGKTTLSKELALLLHAPWVGEYARQYLDELTVPYNYDDLEIIAQGQKCLESSISSQEEHSWIVADTDLLTIKIWGQYKFGKYPSWIDSHLKQNLPDLYFLCGIDMPWVSDPQREHPHQRNELYLIYQQEIVNLGASHVSIKGSKEKRLQHCLDALDVII